MTYDILAPFFMCVERSQAVNLHNFPGVYFSRVEYTLRVPEGQRVHGYMLQSITNNNQMRYPGTSEYAPYETTAATFSPFFHVRGEKSGSDPA